MDRAIDLNRPGGGQRTAPGNVFDSFRRCPFSVKHEELVPGEFSCFEQDAPPRDGYQWSV